MLYILKPVEKVPAELLAEIVKENQTYTRSFTNTSLTGGAPYTSELITEKYVWGEARLNVETGQITVEIGDEAGDE